jgi:transposase
MTTPKDRPDMGPIEVITSVQRRRRWSPEEKRSILEEAEFPGNSLSSVARKYGVNPNQLFHWRKLMREGALVAVGSDEQVVPASEVMQLTCPPVLDQLDEGILVGFGLLEPACELGRGIVVQ